MEILSPAGSLKSLKAAVLSGADAVYMGYGDFNARRNAKNFTKEEFCEGVAFCKNYNVKVYVTMNILLTDRELESAVEFIHFLAKLDIDAVIVQDLGVLNLIKQICPTMNIHASTQLTVHNLAGVKQCEKLGFKRVVLSREVSFEDAKFICENSNIEIEIFVHGALCMSYSGQCYFSSVIGSRSGNRGLCAQPCRLPYNYDGQKNKHYALSLKDLSLINYIQELREIGVACLKIEGRMKREEYTALVTRIYKTVLAENRKPLTSEIDMLNAIFSRNGFTDGYFTKKLDNMFGIKETANAEELIKLLESVKSEYSNKKLEKRVDFNFFARKSEQIHLNAVCQDYTVDILGETADTALNRATTKQDIEQNLAKTGGTIFKIGLINVNIDQDLYISKAEVNKLRRIALEKLEKCMQNVKKHTIYQPNFNKIKNIKHKIKFSVEITNLSQISDTMYKNMPEILYIPIELVCENIVKIKVLLQKGFNICAKMPKIVSDSQMKEMSKMLDIIQEIGIKNLLVTNIYGIYSGFNLYGDYSLNIYNSKALEVAEKLDFKRQTLSFELKTAQIRDISKCIDTEIFAYGKLPLMIFENCLIKKQENACVCNDKNVYLNDRKNEKFALLQQFGCRNLLINSKPLYILDKINEFENIGIKTLRLYFTTENTRECDKIYNAYITKTDINIDYTRGLYYRGAI